MCIVKNIDCSFQCTTSVFVILIVLCAVLSVQYTVYSLQCAVEYTPPPSPRDHPWFAGQHPQVPGDQARLPPGGGRVTG